MPDLFASHHGLFDAVRAKADAVEAEVAAELDFIPKYMQYTSQHRKKRKLGGDEKLAALRHTLSLLDAAGYQRSAQQQRFHDAFIAGCIRRIYGAGFDSAMKRIMSDNNWTRVQQEVCIITPRRFGKTYSVAMYATAWAYSQSATEVSIFSTGRRASKKLLRLIKEMLCKLPGGEEMIVMDNMEELMIRGPDGTLRKINSYPSKVETLKGMGGDIIICEEVITPAPPPPSPKSLAVTRHMHRQPFGRQRADGGATLLVGPHAVGRIQGRGHPELVREAQEQRVAAQIVRLGGRRCARRRGPARRRAGGRRRGPRAAGAQRAPRARLGARAQQCGHHLDVFDACAVHKLRTAVGALRAFLLCRHTGARTHREKSFWVGGWGVGVGGKLHGHRGLKL